MYWKERGFVIKELRIIGEKGIGLELDFGVSSFGSSEAIKSAGGLAIKVGLVRGEE